MNPTPRIVSSPAKKLPALACDTHAHVFGPFDQFPLAADRWYTPPLAPFDDYQAMLASTGFERGVLVHASASGFDCSVTLDALRRAEGRLRGIVVVPPEVPDKELQTMDAAGIRGVRFTQTAAPADAKAGPGTLPLAELQRFGPRLRELGWHAVIWAKCEFIVEAAPSLLSHGIPLVIDHMGFFDTARGVADPCFQAFLKLLETGRIWVKLTAIRNSKTAPDYPEVRPFHEALLRAAPDRLLWGSDWPYLGLDANPPDAGKLLDLFDSWTNDETLRQKILVNNPGLLYGF